MNILTWLKWLIWSLFALWTMSSIIGNETAETLFHCLYKKCCDLDTFVHLRKCWLMLASETKDVIQKCTMSTCNLHLPDYFSMEDLCGENISFNKKKNCFFACIRNFADYVGKLENEVWYGSVYESILHSRNCLSPYLEKCLQS